MDPYGECDALASSRARICFAMVRRSPVPLRALRYSSLLGLQARHSDKSVQEEELGDDSSYESARVGRQRREHDSPAKAAKSWHVFGDRQSGEGQDRCGQGQEVDLSGQPRDSCCHGKIGTGDGYAQQRYTDHVRNLRSGKQMQSIAR
jgi:hypothetical protein